MSQHPLQVRERASHILQDSISAKYSVLLASMRCPAFFPIPHSPMHGALRVASAFLISKVSKDYAAKVEHIFTAAAFAHRLPLPPDFFMLVEPHSQEPFSQLKQRHASRNPPRLLSAIFPGHWKATSLLSSAGSRIGLSTSVKKL